MRYLVFGDVHANLVALEAVLGVARRRRIDAYLFVGDLVGYGPSPLECIKLLSDLHRDERLAWVAGNHDLAVRGEDDIQRFSAEAAETLTWTSSLLAKEAWAREFIAAASVVTHVKGGIYLTHDSLVHPASGNYHRATENAKVELEHLTGRSGKIAFYGHTHTMRAEVLAGASVMMTPMTPCESDKVDIFPLELGKDERAWVGTGSVGFPTRKKGAAEYLVLDDATWTIEKYAVEFSRDAARARVHEILGPVCSPAVVERIAVWL